MFLYSISSEIAPTTAPKNACAMAYLAVLERSLEADGADAAGGTAAGVFAVAAAALALLAVEVVAAVADISR